MAGLSSLLVVFLLLVYWYSGWYGVPYFRCRPRVFVFSLQHDDTHGTWLMTKIHDIWYVIKKEVEEQRTQHRYFERQRRELVKCNDLQSLKRFSPCRFYDPSNLTVLLWCKTNCAKKPDGGLCLIALGKTFCRSSAKCARFHVLPFLKTSSWNLTLKTLSIR